MLVHLQSKLSIPAFVKAGILLLSVLGTGFAQFTIESKSLESIGPGIASITGGLEFSYEEDVRGIILTARQGNEILAQADVPLSEVGQGQAEMGVYLMPIIGACEDAPTLFVHLYLDRSEGKREATSTYCFTLGDNVRLSTPFPALNGPIQNPELDQWYAAKAIRIESEETFERPQDAKSFIVFYVFFSSQDLPELEQDYPPLPTVSTLADIEAIALESGN